MRSRARIAAPSRWCSSVGPTLEQGDRPGIVARPGGRLAALERETGALVQLHGLAALAGLLVEPGRGLVLARPGVGRGGPGLEAGAHVDGAGGGVAVARLVGGGGFGQFARRLEQLGGPEVVLPLLEERGRLGDALALERHLAPEVGRANAVAGPVEGVGRALGILGAHEQLGRVREAAELHAHLARLGEVLALDVDVERLLQLPGLLVELAGLARRLLLPRRARGRIGRGVGDVLHEVLLVAVGRLQRVAGLRVGLGRPQGVAALGVQIGRLVPLAGLAEETSRVEGVAFLEEERGGLGRLVGVDEDLAGLLVVAGLGRTRRPARRPQPLRFVAAAKYSSSM
jgi:hypothetical protein